MADIDRVELLIGLSNNLRADNDAWRKEVFIQGRERAMRANEMIARFEQEYAALDQERQRLSQYLPRQVQQEQMPKVVQQGPKVAG